jgi:hypothetical protein
LLRHLFASEQASEELPLGRVDGRCSAACRVLLPAVVVAAIFCSPARCLAHDEQVKELRLKWRTKRYSLLDMAETPMPTALVDHLLRLAGQLLFDGDSVLSTPAHMKGLMYGGGAMDVDEPMAQLLTQSLRMTIDASLLDILALPSVSAHSPLQCRCCGEYIERHTSCNRKRVLQTFQADNQKHLWRHLANAFIGVGESRTRGERERERERERKGEGG